MPKPRRWTKRQAARVKGYRSGLEDDLAVFLSTTVQIDVEYEKEKIAYVVPESKHKYTPDFKLPNGIYIETKGRFVAADKKKHLLIKQQHPELDIRFIFSNANATSSKQTKITNAEWCDKHGFKFCSIRDQDTIREWCSERSSYGSDQDPTTTT